MSTSLRLAAGCTRAERHREGLVRSEVMDITGGGLERATFAADRIWYGEDAWEDALVPNFIPAPAPPA